MRFGAGYTAEIGIQAHLREQAAHVCVPTEFKASPWSQKANRCEFLGNSGDAAGNTGYEKSNGGSCFSTRSESRAKAGSFQANRRGLGGKTGSLPGEERFTFS